MVMVPDGVDATTPESGCAEDEAPADIDDGDSATLADVIAAVIAATGSSGIGGAGIGTQLACRSSHWHPSGGRPRGCRVMPAAVSASFCFCFSAARRAARCSGVSVRPIVWGHDFPAVIAHTQFVSPT